jgi:hypothetical protein
MGDLGEGEGAALSGRKTTSQEEKERYIYISIRI